MIFLARRVALVMIPLLAGLGLLVLAWSLVFGPAPVSLPPPAFSTQAAQPHLLPVAPPQATTLPAITIATDPYHHPSGTFTINYPDGWQVDEAEDSVQFTAPSEETVQFSVTFVVGMADGEQSEYERDLRQTWGDLSAFSIQTIEADQSPDHWSAHFTYTQVSPPNQTATQMQSLSIYWRRDSVRYNFVALVASQTWGQVETVIQAIANSLQTFPNAIIIETE